MDGQNYIELVSVPFQAGESKLFHISGRYFELIDATDPVDVVLTDKYGAQRGLMRQAEASFNLKATEFSTVQLTSATAQTVRFAYGTGEGGTRRAAGAVSIVGTVPVSGPLTDAQLRAAPVPVRVAELPVANWNSLTTLVANTPLTVFTPGANVNGALVHWMAAHENFVTAQNLVFIAKSSAPTSPTDGEVIAQGIVRAVLAGQEWVGLDHQAPTRIAPGLGLYLISGGNGTANRLKACRYTLL